ncbi:hypothetical protein T492DRAFT_882407 [Pavlovales sp. CCMP2436]|nr:hypothetical protein T492DRAFT_882407 [Pavlovales sp. CCMP2436]
MRRFGADGADSADDDGGGDDGADSAGDGADGADSADDDGADSADDGADSADDGAARTARTMALTARATALTAMALATALRAQTTTDGADHAGDGADDGGSWDAWKLQLDSAGADVQVDLRAISGVPRSDLLKVYAALDAGGAGIARLSLEQVRQVLSVQPSEAVGAPASDDGSGAGLPTGGVTEERARLVVDALLARGWARTEPLANPQWTHVWPTTDGEWHAQGMRTLNAVQDLAVTRITRRLHKALEARLSQGKPYAWGQVNRNWPRALLDAPCAFGKTVTPDLGVVVIFEPLLALVRQSRDEWHKWLTRPGGVSGLCADDVKALVVCSDTSLARPRKRAPSVQQQQQQEEEDSEALEADLLRTGCAEWAPLASGTQARDDVFKFLARAEPGSTDVGKLRVMFVTYASVEPPIGLAVFDEAHTTAMYTKRGAKGEETLVAPLYARALDDIDLLCERRLFMTATPKMTRVDEYEGDAGSSRSCSMEAFELYGSRSSGTSVHGARLSLPFDRAVALGLVVDYKIFAMGVDPEALPASCSRAAALRSLVADDCLHFELEGKSRCARVIELAKACCIERMILDHKVRKVLTFHRLIGADGASEGPAQTGPTTARRKLGELFGAVGMCAQADAVVPSLVERMQPLPQLELDGEDYS